MNVFKSVSLELDPTVVDFIQKYQVLSEKDFDYVCSAAINTYFLSSMKNRHLRRAIDKALEAKKHD